MIVSSVITGLYTFWLTPPTVGSTTATAAQKRAFARDSWAFNQRDPIVQLFQNCWRAQTHSPRFPTQVLEALEKDLMEAWEEAAALALRGEWARCATLLPISLLRRAYKSSVILDERLRVDTDRFCC